MCEIRFTVPAIPVAQPRPRATTRRGKGGQVRAGVHEVTSIKKSDGTRKPHPILAYKSTVAMAACSAYSGPPINGPIVVDCVFVLPRVRPPWLTRKDFPNWFARWKAGDRIPKTAKPDRDNLDKATLDAMDPIWGDDAQVYDGRITKWVAADNEQPHVDIKITWGDLA